MTTFQGQIRFAIIAPQDLSSSDKHESSKVSSSLTRAVPPSVSWQAGGTSIEALCSGSTREGHGCDEDAAACRVIS